MNEFVGNIPKFFGFEKGDEFKVSPELPVFTEVIDPMRGTAIQYTPVVNQFGEERKLYPSQLCRRLTDKDGRNVYATGSAVDVFKSFKTIAEGMDALRGKTIRVSEDKIVELHSGMRKHVYTFDFV